MRFVDQLTELHPRPFGVVLVDLSSAVSSLRRTHRCRLRSSLCSLFLPRCFTYCRPLPSVLSWTTRTFALAVCLNHRNVYYALLRRTAPTHHTRFWSGRSPNAKKRSVKQARLDDESLLIIAERRSCSPLCRAVPGFGLPSLITFAASLLPAWRVREGSQDVSKLAASDIGCGRVWLGL